jgi:hypothetical protein
VHTAGPGFVQWRGFGQGDLVIGTHRASLVQQRPASFLEKQRVGNAGEILAMMGMWIISDFLVTRE